MKYENKKTKFRVTGRFPARGPVSNGPHGLPWNGFGPAAGPVSSPPPGATDGAVSTRRQWRFHFALAGLRALTGRELAATARFWWRRMSVTTWFRWPPAASNGLSASHGIKEREAHDG
jgi:hypothetical protein